MAQNITLLGASYSDVPSVLLPKTGGGTASFTDVTDTTAAAADVASGKYFYTSAGVRMQGTSTGGGGTEAGTVTQDADGFLVLDDDPPAGPTLITKSITANGTYNASSDNADGYSSVTVNVSGGGGGLEYETGTWTPSSDIADYTIPFANTHTTAPFYYLIYDSGDSFVGVSGSNTMMALTTWSGGFKYGNSVTWYGTARYSYASSASGGGATAFNITDTNTLSLYTSSTGIRAYANNDTRYWRAGRTYKWIAVWAPSN